MRRLFLLAAVCCCLVGNLKAQENGFFNHVAAGVQVGLNGVGAELAVPVGSVVQLRAGYSFIPSFSYKRTEDIPEHPGAVGSAKGRDVPVSFEASTNVSDFEFLIDIFPYVDGGFHFTAGLLYGPKDLIKVSNTTPLPSDYNTVGLDVDGYTVKAKNGILDAYIGVNSFRPYVGLGFGRPVDPRHRVSVTFDLGAVYWGKPGLFAPGEPLIGDWKDVRITSDSIAGYDEGVIELAEKFQFFPMLNLHLFVKLF